MRDGNELILRAKINIDNYLFAVDDNLSSANIEHLKRKIIESMIEELIDVTEFDFEKDYTRNQTIIIGTLRVLE
jgi:hypothetical protein